MTYAEFLVMEEEFITGFNNGTIDPEVEGWPTVDAEVMCDTPGCMVENQVFFMPLSIRLDKVYVVICGRCSTQVHYVMGVFSDGNRPLKTTYEV